MKTSLLIFRHYFRRALIEPIGIIMLTLVPIALILLNVYVFGFNVEPMMINGYCAMATGATIMIMVMFQFFGGMYINEWIHEDFRGAQRWRLFSAPVSQNKFVFSAAIASWLITFVQGLVLIGVSALFLNAYWGNFRFWIPVLLMLSTISQLMYIIIALFTKNKRTAEAIGHALTFGMAFLGGIMFINVGVLTRIPTPMSTAFRAIGYSSLVDYCTSTATTNMLYLAGFLVVLAVAAIIAGRRRNI